MPERKGGFVGFDRSALRHRLAVVSSAPFVYDVFVRTDDGAIEHYWTVGQEMLGPEGLGGRFDTDPVAVLVAEPVWAWAQ